MPGKRYFTLIGVLIGIVIFMACFFFGLALLFP